MVPLELTHSTYGDHVVLSTADIAFVAAGAFSGFQQVAQHRRSRGSIGFGREGAADMVDADKIAVDFKHEEVESVANFQAYGFLPELIARFTRVIPFRALDNETLKDILTLDVVDKMIAEFKDEGFELVVEDAVLDHIVTEAIRQETGARGLSSTLTRALEEIAFDAFGDEAGGQVVVSMVDGRISTTSSSSPHG